MPITKRTEIDQIVIEPGTGIVLWRTSTVIEEDGVELSRTYHRGSVEPGFDASHVPAEVEVFRAQVQTPDKIAKAAERRRKSKLPGQRA